MGLLTSGYPEQRRVNSRNCTYHFHDKMAAHKTFVCCLLEAGILQREEEKIGGGGRISECTIPTEKYNHTLPEI